MSDQELAELAAKAGVSPEWTDQQSQSHAVSPDTLRAILGGLGLPCATQEELRNSLARLEVPHEFAGVPPLLTTRVGLPIVLPGRMGRPTHAKVVFEDGSSRDFVLDEGPHDSAVLPAIDVPGYHRVEAGDRDMLVAVAPTRGLTVADIAPNDRIWGLGAQVYGLRRAGDGGIGDMSGVAALAKAAAHRGCDALTLSPMHALFSADPGHFGPYSPSSRLFYNPLHADPAIVFGEERVRAAIVQARVQDEMARLEQLELIDWPLAARAKLVMLRSLFESLERDEHSSSPQPALAHDFKMFVEQGGDLLLQHARFEALHAARLMEDRGAWSWRSWPEEWRDPNGPAVAAFAAEHDREVRFHLFLQWLADRSLAHAQSSARQAGMSVGLVSDVAIGMDGGGSHAWSRQSDVLVGMSVGAPPDYYNANGQNWGLTSFSPHALVATGFAPFIATLRAALRHAGGVRIDHAMGLMRLWLIPEGAGATQGAYVSYPVESLFRLVALESHRHQAIVIGEDLGTLPDGFRQRLDEQGIAGMRVLRFERDEHGYFREPRYWRSTAVAMSTTHDLPPTAGWWRGTDIEERTKLRGFLDEGDAAVEREQREESRKFLWGALRHAGAASTDQPSPEDTDPVVDAAIRFVSSTPCHLAVITLEDALGVLEQPNLPGTVDEHPNWRRRLPGDAAQLLDAPKVEARLETLGQRRRARREAAA